MPTLNHTCHEKYDLYCDISIQRCSGACTVLNISSLQRKRLVWWLKTIMRIPKTELCSLHYILLWMLVGAKRYFSRYGWNLKYSTKPSKWSQTIIQNYFGSTMVPIRQEILATHKCPFNKFTGAWKKKKKHFDWTAQHHMQEAQSWHGHFAVYTKPILHKQEWKLHTNDTKAHHYSCTRKAIYPLTPSESDISRLQLCSKATLNEKGKVHSFLKYRTEKIRIWEPEIIYYFIFTELSIT